MKSHLDKPNAKGRVGGIKVGASRILSRKGFTIIEASICVLAFSILMTGASRLFLSTLPRIKTSERMYVASSTIASFRKEVNAIVGGGSSIGLYRTSGLVGRGVVEGKGDIVSHGGRRLSFIPQMNKDGRTYGKIVLERYNPSIAAWETKKELAPLVRTLPLSYYPFAIESFGLKYGLEIPFLDEGGNVKKKRIETPVGAPPPDETIWVECSGVVGLIL